jgi:MoaA/NifB/PqqE/SkfB family radical SAM enzyme
MKTKKWHEFKRELEKAAEEKGVVSSATFELTARCNLSCNMCYVRCAPAVASQEKSADQWVGLIEQFRDGGGLYALLTGGEVLIRPDFEEIYDRVHGLGVIPTIFTNATLLTKEKVRLLRAKPPEKVGVTLYGASAETYQRVCGTGAAFEQAVRGIDLLLDAGLNLDLKTTVVPGNINDYDALLSFADERNIVLGFCYYIAPPRDSEKRKQQVNRVPAADVAAYLFRASQDYWHRYKQYSVSDCSEKKPTSLRMTPARPFSCAAGKNNPWVQWNGKMVPCGLIDSPCVDVFEVGFIEGCDLLRKEVESIEACSACVACNLQKYCITCPARLMLETGSYNTPAEYMCELAKEQALLYNKS